MDRFGTEKLHFFLFKRFYLFLERGREGEKHQRVVASCVPPTGDLAHNPGMCKGVDLVTPWFPGQYSIH